MQYVFIWSIYIFPKIVELNMEALTIILKLPMILVWIFRTLTWFLNRNGIKPKLVLIFISHLTRIIWKFENWGYKANWNFLTHLEVQEWFGLLSWASTLVWLLGSLPPHFNLFPSENQKWQMHMDAMMQTWEQKVEKFFVFFTTTLGLLHQHINLWLIGRET